MSSRMRTRHRNITHNDSRKICVMPIARMQAALTYTVDRMHLASPYAPTARRKERGSTRVLALLQAPGKAAGSACPCLPSPCGLVPSEGEGGTRFPLLARGHHVPEKLRPESAVIRHEGRQAQKHKAPQYAYRPVAAGAGPPNLAHNSTKFIREGGTGAAPAPGSCEIAHAAQKFFLHDHLFFFAWPRLSFTIPVFFFTDTAPARVQCLTRAGAIPGTRGKRPRGGVARRTVQARSFLVHFAQ